MSMTQTWITQLQLQPHPEGGFFREVYRAAEEIPASALPPRFSGNRSFATSIYFLLRAEDISALHRIQQDEIWHFYAGSPLDIHLITPAGEHRVLKLGPDLAGGQQLQQVVSAGCWFGARVPPPGDYALVGCTVAPGFDFADFELADRATLLAQYPQHHAIIDMLTRQ